MSDQRGARDSSSDGSEDLGADDAVVADDAAAAHDAAGSSRPSGKRAARRTRSADDGPSLIKDGARTTAGKSVATASRVEGRTRAEATPKMNIFKRLRKFLREVVAELRKVIWPNRKQMVTYTAVVLVFVTFMVAYISGLDLAFIRGVQWLFG
ncbi:MULTISPECIES: preprotein translocase subunit SecE [unclassified Rhodococcus (in: high G+C Gram-positive bacteria)]|uniref:preprotein translocase subunit SecE n=1 Tax=unclassified Rhodococcus (in: high G+C Gram-positive bacteria) TaxID=192944 RepID=UPI001C9B6DA9|nr:MULTISPECIES: preprotein translocase subunit SecE [unclassified Rhodococcus (in: high G+C Gram-positive bacteria)]MBY6685006.1 preprotein translocase subunit SecE [Rhodococcus sp. BP-288]MBY6692510.1 preprotein translocase subunit SecE [Rhodococcus sp. BP-188]MBY6698408.1 preprotein translocase subunit SecE [Rhodococcus sp. BP-285]MBY6701087.1 preprotein translocase subunit SecE [Rhodococcus sp. BP-283]MBY6712088.1 preprotein translocase subunit SecE [Rhodococcus sp. BP-160]